MIRRRSAYKTLSSAWIQLQDVDASLLTLCTVHRSNQCRTVQNSKRPAKRLQCELQEVQQQPALPKTTIWC